MASKFAVNYGIPNEFPEVLKAFTREVLRTQPDNVYEFGAAYFSELLVQAEAAAANDSRPQLTQEQLEEELRALFDKYDEDGSGTLTLQEFKEAMAAVNLGLSEKEMKQLLIEADVNDDGVIEYNEFLNMIRELLNVTNEDDLSKVRVYRFWKEIDRDSSGEVDFPEFCAWYLKYFSPEVETTQTSIDGRGILGKFYSSYDPRAQRKSLVADDSDEQVAVN